MTHSTPSKVPTASAPIKKKFPIIGICREDLETLGYDTSGIDDAMMKRVAHELAEDCFEQMFSQSLESVAETLAIPKGRERQDDETIEAILGQAHEEEIVRKDAEAWNLGWGSSVARIESKTSKGILISVIDRKSKQVSHRWNHRRESAGGTA